MKNIIVGMLLLTLLILPLAGCGGEVVNPDQPEPELVEEEPVPAIKDADFRNINWGMSQAEVKERETEGEIVLEDSKLLVIGNLSLAGLDVSLGYRFNVKDQVFGATYLIKEEHTNNTAYITDYKNLKDKLIDKYGAPDEDEIIWLDDLWKDEPSDWGMAIITGDLRYYSRWNLGSFDIILVLKGDNYEVDFMLVYGSNEISKDTGETGDEGL
ncbi:hypothetical protein ES708_26654 [subsurface metagenome]